MAAFVLRENEVMERALVFWTRRMAVINRFSLRIGGCPVRFVSDADLSSVRCRLRISRHNSDHDEEEWVAVGLQGWTELLRLRLKLKRWRTTMAGME